MTQPYNYTIPRPDFGQKFAQGLQIGSVFRDRAAQEREQAAAAEEKAAYAAAAADYQAAPSMAKLNEMTLRFPALEKQFRQVGERLSVEQKEGTWKTASPIAIALESNSPDVAAQLIDTAIEASKNSGQSTAMLDLMKRKIESGDINAAKGIANLTLNAIDSDRYKNLSETLAKERKAPVELKTARAEEKIKTAEAMFAPDKFGLEIDLTESQIEQAKSARRASDAAAKKTGAEAKRAEEALVQNLQGIIPADKRADAEAKFRKEYSDQTKVYMDVKASYGRILASQETAAGDLSLIFNYMKTLDPGSTVREGEFANAQNAGSVSVKVTNLYNNIMSGERLSSGQRTMFKKQSEALYKQALKQEELVRKGIQRISTGYGLNPENIFFDKTETPPSEIDNGEMSASPAINGGQAVGAQTAAPVNQKGWVLHVDAQGNRAFVSPDGKSFEEAR